jgi:hypothetical protein
VNARGRRGRVVGRAKGGRADGEKTTYSLRFGKRSRSGQRHGLQSITLTSLFYKKIFIENLYMYTFKTEFQNKSIDMVFTLLNSMT